jgi:hypothetical protein
MPEFMGFAAIGSTVALMLAYVGATVFPLLYVFARWRTGGRGEPGMGMQAGLLYLRSVALLMFLTGLSLLLHGFVDEDSDSRGMEDMRRVAGGLLLGGAVGYALPLAFLRMGAIGRSEAVHRLFDGFVLMVSGVMTLGAVTVTGVVLFLRKTDFDDLRAPLVWAAVWLCSFLLHAVSLVRGSAGGYVGPESAAAPPVRG